MSVRRDLISFGWPHVGPRVFASALPSFFLKKTGLVSFFIQPIWHTRFYKIINIKIKIKNK